MKFSVFNFFKEPPFKDILYDDLQIKKQYSFIRPQLFISCFVAYFTFYLCKKNFAVALPSLSNEFGFTNVELGLIGSSLYFTYGIGKFINGVLINKCDVKRILPSALIITGLINLLIVFFSIFRINPIIYLWIIIFLWGLNGWIQSIAFPAVIKILTYWTTNTERGTIIAIWSPSHLIGILVSAVMSGYLAVNYGWRMVFVAPAIFAIFISIILFFTLQDKPQTVGLPPLEEDIKNTIKSKSTLSILKNDIIYNKTLWLLAVSYIFVYIIRLGTEDWLVKYLVDVKGNSIDFAAKKLCILPLVGIIGSILAGSMSDRLFKGNRLPVNLIFLSIIIVAFILLEFNSADYFDFIIIAVLGIGIYGVQIMIGGLCAIESTSKEMAAAATGFTGLFGYLGAFLSSICAGYIIDNWGWNGTLLFWILSAVICFILCILSKNSSKVK